MVARTSVCTRRLLAAQLAWTFIVLWAELGTFYAATADCPWPDAALDTLATPVHVLIVADPQLLDADSYPGRHPFLMALSQLVADTFLRKAWRAALRTRPHAVVFLGDMLDNGRAERGHNEYRAYVSKFKRIFAKPRSLPAFYLPGNHDVWLGGADARAQLARARFKTYFGPLNSASVLGNHSLVFVDAPQLVEDERERAREGTGLGQWRPKAIQELVKVVEMGVPEGRQPWPRVLFSHIPLARVDGTDCGPLREKGTLRAGHGFGYENTLSEAASRMLLDTFRPSLVFSGDDHDYCDVTHAIAPSDDHAITPPRVHEISVKSLSMVMGIRRPGFELLSLATPRAPGALSAAHAPCTLPDQLGIYLHVYAPLFALSLVAILVHAVRRGARRVEPDVLPKGEGGEARSWMPEPVRRRVFAMERTALGRFALDLGTVAWPPLLVFSLIMFWLS